jgi:bifunctional DNA-binding transcriptional regulator/antitoxin component of YhaV-PrlF toxin-antitoxin module
MEITKLSTKGQIVIPEKLRSEFAVGDSFVVSKVGEMIVLKPIVGLSKEEQKELQEVEKIWREIDADKATSYSQEEFFDAMKQW